MYQRIAKILTSALVAFSVVSPVSAATTVTVKADKPSGTYEAPFDVRIQASDPTAKIWYAFDPNGSPGDALPYSKPIRIEKSTPLLFFAYTDYEHESKIERRDYVVLSPTTLRFKDASVSIAAEAADFSVTVENFWSAPVRLSGWTLRTDKDAFAVSRDISLAAGASTTFGPVRYGAGAATLSAPNGDVVGTLAIVREAPKPKPAEPVKTQDSTAVRPASEPAVPTVPPELPATIPAETTPTAAAPEAAPTVPSKIPEVPTSQLMPAEPVTAPAEQPTAVGTPEPDEPSIKLSAGESWTADSSSKKAVAAGILAILAGAAGVRGVLEWKKRKAA